MREYVKHNGEVVGAAEPPAQPPPRRRPPNRLQLRARRVREDPNWASLSKETKEMLLDLDAKESR